MDEESPQTVLPKDTASIIIDRWFRDHIHGSVVARNVDVYNHLHAAVEELKRRLSKRSE